MHTPRLANSDGTIGGQNGWRESTCISYNSSFNAYRYAVLNTGYDLQTGITCGNNFSGETHFGSNVFLVSTGTSGAGGSVDLPMYLFSDSDNITGIGDNVYNISGTFLARFATSGDVTDITTLNADSRFTDIIGTDPQLTDPDNGDFRPINASPIALNGSYVCGDGTDVRQVFLDRYGLDIAYDQQGNPRTVGAMSKGAFEAA